MLKKILSIIAVLTLGLVQLINAQTVLTEASHGLQRGYTNDMHVTRWDNPGNTGDAVVFNFSQLPDLGSFHGENLDPSVAQTPVQFMMANSVLQEDRLQAFLSTSTQELLVLGLRLGNGAQEMVRTYHEPVVKMRYPFSYGDHYKQQTTATDSYSCGYSHDIYYDYSVTADAQGTLLLPGVTLKEVLRVSTEQTVRSANANGGSYTVVTYRWYVQSHRFPVLVLIYSKQANGSLHFLQGAYNPVEQPILDNEPIPEVAPISVADLQEKLAKSNPLLNSKVYPNPFSTQLSVTYGIKEAAEVTIGLYTLEGQLLRTLFHAQQQPGEYTHHAQGLEGLAEGQYIVVVRANGHTLSSMTYHAK